MVRPQEKNGWARLDEQENLRRLLDGGEAGEWLLDPIIEDTEIFATKAFDEMTAMIGDNHSHVDAVNADSNGWLLRVFLSLNKGTHARHGRQEQCRRHEADRKSTRLNSSHR